MLQRGLRTRRWVGPRGRLALCDRSLHLGSFLSIVRKQKWHCMYGFDIMLAMKCNSSPMERSRAQRNFLKDFLKKNLQHQIELRTLKWLDAGKYSQLPDVYKFKLDKFEKANKGDNLGSNNFRLVLIHQVSQVSFKQFLPFWLGRYGNISVDLVRPLTC